MKNLEMGAFIRKDTFKESLEEVLTIFPELKDRIEQKIVAISRAPILKPTLLLLDEPLSGLSPKLIENQLKKLLSINESGTSLLIVEQNAKKSLAVSRPSRLCSGEG